MTDRVEIDPGDPRDPAATALLQASHTLMTTLFPVESNHFLSIDALCAPEVSFFVARHGGNTVGCAALAQRTGYGELKSMFVDPAARGLGVGRALLLHAEQVARDADLAVLRLETGTLLTEAQALYASAGFSVCGPFGDYDVGPFNVFYEKSL